MTENNDPDDMDALGKEVVYVAIIIAVCGILALTGGLIGGLLWGWLA